MSEENLYYSYARYLANRYGEKVYKLPINLPISCPNRLNGHSGCIFCAECGTGFEAMDNSVSVKKQLTSTKEYIGNRYHAKKFIAYFQNYTNTFMPLKDFRRYLDEAMLIEDIVEISISTRPDCINESYLEILDEIRKKYNVNITIELGLQTINYRTLQFIQRGHGLAEFLDAVLKIKMYDFQICCHMILNLPGDEMIDSIEAAKVLSALKIDVVKLHSLYIAKNTRLCDLYENATISMCSKEEYFHRACLFLDYLSPDIAVERLFSRVPEKDAIFANWGTSWWKLKDELLNMMINEGHKQGVKFNYLNGSALKLL